MMGVFPSELRSESILDPAGALLRMDLNARRSPEDAASWREVVVADINYTVCIV